MACARPVRTSFRQQTQELSADSELEAGLEAGDCLGKACAIVQADIRAYSCFERCVQFPSSTYYDPKYPQVCSSFMNNENDCASACFETDRTTFNLFRLVCTRCMAQPDKDCAFCQKGSASCHQLDWCPDDLGTSIWNAQPDWDVIFPGQNASNLVLPGAKWVPPEYQPPNSAHKPTDSCQCASFSTVQSATVRVKTDNGCVLSEGEEPWCDLNEGDTSIGSGAWGYCGEATDPSWNPDDDTVFGPSFKGANVCPGRVSDAVPDPTGNGLLTIANRK